MSEPSEKPKFTVIIPTCNEAAFIETCVRAVLANVDGNKTLAAKILGIDRKTLREKLKHLDASKR